MASGRLVLDDQFLLLARGQAHRLEGRALFLQDHLLGDLAAADILARGNLVHHVEQHVLDDGAQAARAGLVLERFTAPSLGAPRG